MTNLCQQLFQLFIEIINPAWHSFYNSDYCHWNDWLIMLSHASSGKQEKTGIAVRLNTPSPKLLASVEAE